MYVHCTFLVYLLYVWGLLVVGEVSLDQARLPLPSFLGKAKVHSLQRLVRYGKQSLL